MIFVACALLVATFLALGFFRVKSWVWHVSMILLALMLTLVSTPFWLLLVLLWLPFALTPVRQAIFAKPLLNFFNANLPEMSDTERDALEAGDVWFEAELFKGSPNWDKWLANPQPKLTNEEQHFLDNEVKTLCGMLDDWQITNGPHQDLPAPVWRYLKERGFFGLIIKKEYGGREFSALAHSAIITKIATRSITASITAMVPNSLGPAELLEVYGTDEQKSYYLPRLASGVEIPCFALTAPHSGSDAATMRDYGLVCEQVFEGELTLGISLSFDKRYITLAPIATLVGLAFRLYDPEKHLGEEEEIGITLCLLPANHPGVEIGKRHLPMKLPFMNGPIRGNNVFIPLKWVIGGPNYVGQGWKMLMNCLSTGRSISLPATSAAASQLCYRMTGAYAMIRKQFNVSIAKFEGVEEKLAQIAGLTYMIGACCEVTAGAVDLGIKPSLVSAIAKYHTTEMSRKVVNDAMDIHGGRAIQLGPRNYLYGPYMGIPVGITVEGANILTRNLLIFGQGLMRCHPYLLDEMHFARANKLPEFDQRLCQHVGYTFANACRSFIFGLSNAAFVESSQPASINHFYKHLTRMSSVFAFISDVAILFYGGQLKRKERMSARLGDVLSYLYLASCVLKQFKDHDHAEDELTSVSWSCEYSLYEIQCALRDVINNFPNRLVRAALKVIIFPLGKRAKKPSDALEHELIKQMTALTKLRYALTKSCYIGDNMSDPTGKVELTFEMLMTMHDIEKKFCAALKAGDIQSCRSNLDDQLTAAVRQCILTEDEAERYRVFSAMRDDVIAVDEFETVLSKKESVNYEA